MNYLNFINKYNNTKYDIFAYSYFIALEKLVGSDKAQKYIDDAIKEKHAAIDSMNVANKLLEENKSKR